MRENSSFEAAAEETALLRRGSLERKEGRNEEFSFTFWRTIYRT